MHSFDQQLQIAVNHHKAGALAQAEVGYRQLLAMTPNDARILHALGVLCQQTGRRDLAIQFIQKAIDIRPDFPEAFNNLSVSLNEVGRCDYAIKACEKAIRLKPDYAPPHINLGNALRELGRLEEAIRQYRKAANLQPPTSVLMTNLSAALHDLGDADAGIAAATEAVRLNPQSAEAHQALGHNLKAAGRIDAALQSYDAAIQLKPSDASLHSSRLYCLNYSTVHDQPSIQQELNQWNDRHARRFLADIKPHTNDRSPDRRLRIGFVSPNFRAHPMSFFTMPILRCHDRRQFEIFCYSDVMRPDAVTDQMRQHADQWRNIVGRGDDEVAGMIRADRIDILVDPNMHMARNRLLVFARKPAPVQVTWLGTPGSSGLATMDYRLTDPYFDPPGSDDRLYSETLIRLPKTFWCYDPLTDQPEVNPLPSTSTGHITFGCLNSFYKINIGVIELFAKVLQVVPVSRLVMLCSCESGRISTRDHFQNFGIDTSRIEFVGFRPRPEYLRTYHRIDISLDVLPHNGHTSSIDSLWMGVPVVSLVGSTAVGRAGLSILTNVNLPELIARSPAEYIEIAATLSSDLKHLSDLRESLRSRLTASPLMDAPRFARDIEDALRTMWCKPL